LVKKITVFPLWSKSGSVANVSPLEDFSAVMIFLKIASG